MFVVIRENPYGEAFVQSVGNYNDTVFETIKEAKTALKWTKEELMEAEVRHAGKLSICKLVLQKQ